MLDELIQAAEKLCNNLEQASNNEKTFTTDICVELNKYRQNMKDMYWNLQDIKNYCQ